MIIIEKNDVQKLLAPDQAVSLMKRAFREIETGESGQPLRMLCKMPNTATFGFMPAFVGQDYFGAKIIAAYAPNMGTKYPSHIGYVMLYEAQHCTVVAMVEAGSITSIRTGAASAAATDLLARPEASHLALIGAGAQARSHTAAIRSIRDLSGITVCDINRDQAERFRQQTEAAYGLPVRICDTVEETVAEADMICTLTPSREPLLFRDMVRPGTHINAVGTFTPTTREVSSNLVAAARLYADKVESCRNESGEYLIPLQEGLVGEDHIIGSIGDILLGNASGRQSADEITIFNALGLAVEDVMSAVHVYQAYLKQKA